jgi:hypothetical protein
LTLEIRDKERHRRFALAFDRCFFEADAPDPDKEFQSVSAPLKLICKNLEIEAVTRVGIRQWFAADLNKPFALMVDELTERFHVRSEQLASFLPDKTHDFSYTMVYKTKDDWRYQLRFGPMEKKQWFQTVFHEPTLHGFGQEDDEKNTFGDLWQSVPDQFVYIDIDFIHENQTAQKIDEFLVNVRRKSHEVVEKLIEFCKR